MRYILLFFILLSPYVAHSQEVLVLKNGQKFEGKLTKADDTLIVFNTLINGNLIDLNFNKSKVERIVYGNEHNVKENKKVKVLLNSRKYIFGNLVSETDDGYTLAHGKNMKDTLYLRKSQVEKMVPITSDRTAFVDIGFLRAGALIGTELEFVIGSHSTLFLGAGYRGYAAGFNFFFDKDYKGIGIKTAYNNVGFGDTYYGSLLSGTLFFKMDKGISMDLGLAKVLARKYSSNYYGQEYILYYGAGIRF